MNYRNASLVVLSVIAPLVPFVVTVGGVLVVGDALRNFFVWCSSVIDSLLKFLLYNELLLLVVAILVVTAGLVISIVHVTNQLYRSQKISRQVKQRQLSEYEPGINLVQDQRLFAFTVGFLKPRIYVSSALHEKFEKDEIAAVVAHERYHQRNYHTLALLWVGTLRACFFYMPVIGSICEYLRQVYEYRADQYAINMTSRESLAKALYKVMRQEEQVGISGPVVLFASCEQRVACIVSSQPHQKFSHHCSLGKRTASALVIGGIAIALGSPFFYSDGTFLQQLGPDRQGMTPEAYCKASKVNFLPFRKHKLQCSQSIEHDSVNQI